MNLCMHVSTYVFMCVYLCVSIYAYVLHVCAYVCMYMLTTYEGCLQPRTTHNVCACVRMHIYNLYYLKRKLENFCLWYLCRQIKIVFSSGKETWKNPKIAAFTSCHDVCADQNEFVALPEIFKLRKPSIWWQVAICMYACMYVLVRMLCVYVYSRFKLHEPCTVWQVAVHLFVCIYVCVALCAHTRTHTHIHANIKVGKRGECLCRWVAYQTKMRDTTQDKVESPKPK